MVGLALFGCGRIGKVHAESIAAHPQAELIWVCDPMEEAARSLAAKYGAAASRDAGTVLADPRVDALVVASPTPTHVDLLTRSVRAGKAVLCEKPIDLDLARVDACWREIAGATSGGLFRDMTIHDFDMARYFLGEVTEVHAMGANLVAGYITELGDIDAAVISLRGAGGALCHITNSRHCAFGYDQRIEAFGERGMLTAENLRPTSVRFTGADETEAADPYLNFFLDRFATAYRAELAHFLNAIGTGTQPAPGFADGRAALALAEAAIESARTGRVVRTGGGSDESPFLHASANASVRVRDTDIGPQWLSWREAPVIEGLGRMQ